MKTFDVILLAFRSVRSNLLRTSITVIIIALGIMALIGITTAIQAMNQKLTESFSSMGSNGFTIRYKERNIHIGNDNDDLTVSKKSARKQKQSNLNKVITQEEAERFLAAYKFPANAGISAFGGRNAILSYQSAKTSPNVFMFGGDEFYLDLNGFELDAGRNFTHQEVQSGQNVCLLGHDVAVKLYKINPLGAVGKIIRINDVPFRVIGVLVSRGSSFGFSRDNIAIIGYKNIRKYFGTNAYSIGVKTFDLNQVQNGMGEAEGLFRAVRKLSASEESNFVVERSDSVAEKAMNVLGFLTAAVIVIGFITLIGSAIGLMNIMLVSVTERTKEVGLVKAIGGKKSAVRQQFLCESVIISVMGAFLGIVLGVLIGNLLSIALGTGFVVPWNWAIGGIGLCTAVGLIAGLYPALKAGKLNPIEALRYE